MNQYEGMRYIIVDNNAKILYDDIPFTNDYNTFTTYHEQLKKIHGQGTFLKYEECNRLINISNVQDYNKALTTITGQGMILLLEIRSDQYNDWRCKICDNKNTSNELICSVCKRKRY